MHPHETEPPKAVNLEPRNSFRTEGPYALHPVDPKGCVSCRRGAGPCRPERFQVLRGFALVASKLREVGGGGGGVPLLKGGR